MGTLSRDKPGHRKPGRSENVAPWVLTATERKAEFCLVSASGQCGTRARRERLCQADSANFSDARRVGSSTGSSGCSNLIGILIIGGTFTFS